jgi:hypothetical protein
VVKRPDFFKAADPAQELRHVVPSPPPAGPAGIGVRKVSHTGEAVEIRLVCDRTKIKAGTEGNPILQAFGERANPANVKTGARGPRSPLGIVPAIPFEVTTAPSETSQ